MTCRAKSSTISGSFQVISIMNDQNNTSAQPVRKAKSKNRKHTTMLSLSHNGSLFLCALDSQSYFMASTGLLDAGTTKDSYMYVKRLRPEGSRSSRCQSTCRQWMPNDYATSGSLLRRWFGRTDINFYIFNYQR